MLSSPSSDCLISNAGLNEQHIIYNSSLYCLFRSAYLTAQYTPSRVKSGSACDESDTLNLNVFLQCRVRAECQTIRRLTAVISSSYVK